MKPIIKKTILALSCAVGLVAISAEAQAYRVYYNSGYHHGYYRTYYRSGTPYYYRHAARHCGYWRHGHWHATRCR